MASRAFARALHLVVMKYEVAVGRYRNIVRTGEEPGEGDSREDLRGSPEGQQEHYCADSHSHREIM